MSMGRRGFLKRTLAGGVGLVTCIVGESESGKGIPHFPLTPPAGKSVGTPPSTTAFEDRVLEHLYQDVKPLSESTCYIGLIGADGKEISGSGYERQRIEVEADIQSGVLNCTTAIFECSDKDGWGEVDKFQVFNQEHADLFHGSFTSRVRVGDGDSVKLEQIHFTIE